MNFKYPALDFNFLFGIIISIAALSFVAYKAYVTAFTHDEAFTFQYFFYLPEKHILFYHQPHIDPQVLTNNHIFNTYMMKLSESIFGLSELSLRLPNILALLLYLVFSFKILRGLKEPFRSCGFLLLIFNPYLLDFFGLARGYGLSIGFMILSLYFHLKFIQSNRLAWLAGFHLAAIISVMSNFAAINFYAVGIGLLYLYPMIKTGSLWRGFRQISLKQHGLNLGFVVLLAALVIRPFQKIIESKAIYFGGKRTFFEETIGSLVQRTAYETLLSESIITLISVLALLTVLLPLLLMILKIFKKDREFLAQEWQWLILNLYIFLIPVSTIVQHYLFGQDYLVERFAIFLYPLFILNLIYALHYLSFGRGLKIAAYATAEIITLLFVGNLLININTDFYYNWKYDMDNKRVLQILEEEYQKGGIEGPLKLGISSRLEPSLNFYREIWRLDWLRALSRDRPSPEDHYHYIIQQDLQYFPFPAKRTLIKTFDEAGGKLVKLD